MIVTKIEEFKKGRYLIYINGEKSFVLYSGELRTYHIEEGKKIEPETLDEIMSEVLPKRAKLRAMNLLMKRRLTEKGLRTKLQDGEYPPDVIEEAINYVISYGYVDDEAYARDYVEYNRSSKSVSRMMNDLIAKGIDKEVISTIIYEMDADHESLADTEIELIKKLLFKKKYDSATTTNEEKQKIYVYLARKGFSSERIKQAMRDC